MNTFVGDCTSLKYDKHSIQLLLPTVNINNVEIKLGGFFLKFLQNVLKKDNYLKTQCRFPMYLLIQVHILIYYLYEMKFKRNV